MGLTSRRFKLLRLLFGSCVVGFVAVAVIQSWSEVRTSLEAISPVELVLAEALVLAGLAISVQTWRCALRELGSQMRFASAARVYLVGQLGKYVPGSFWALAMQAQLSSGAGVPRSRGLAASVVAMSVNLAVGLALGMALVPLVSETEPWLMFLAALGIIALAASLAPPILTRLVNGALGLFGREPLERDVSWPGILAAAGWSVVSAVSYGLSVWVLAIGVGAPAALALPLCVAGVPLAMAAGFLIFLTPSGLGVREAVTVVVLSPVLDRSEGLAVALVARLLFTAADALAAAAVSPRKIGSRA